MGRGRASSGLELRRVRIRSPKNKLYLKRKQRKSVKITREDAHQSTTLPTPQSNPFPTHFPPLEPRDPVKKVARARQSSIEASKRQKKQDWDREGSVVAVDERATTATMAPKSNIGTPIDGQERQQAYKFRTAVCSAQLFIEFDSLFQYLNRL